MHEDFRGRLMQIVALLERRHGIGLGNLQPPIWLRARVAEAVESLLAARGCDAAALLEQLEHDADLVVALANAVCVGETRFYRDAAQWEALRRHWLPRLWSRLPEPQPLQALSAGCSTGEEAWTLGMLLSEAAPRSASFTVTGVDCSALALVTARSATYDVGSQRHLPRELSQRFLQPAIDGSLRVVPELESHVTFEHHDLTLGVPRGPYALVVCKNVLAHLSDQHRAHVVRTLLSSLTADGILLVARSEVPILQGLGARAREIAPDITVFRSH